jgi:hypothetical protein
MQFTNTSHANISHDYTPTPQIDYTRTLQVDRTCTSQVDRTCVPEINHNHSAQIDPTSHIFSPKM